MKPLHKESGILSNGQRTRFSTKAKGSACLVALTYLKDTGLVVVENTNICWLEKIQAKT
jgi:hypothetical protein